MAAPSKGVDPRDKPEGDGVRCLPLSSIFMGDTEGTEARGDFKQDLCPSPCCTVPSVSPW